MKLLKNLLGVLVATAVFTGLIYAGVSSGVISISGGGSGERPQMQTTTTDGTTSTDGTSTTTGSETQTMPSGEWQGGERQGGSGGGSFSAITSNALIVLVMSLAVFAFETVLKLFKKKKPLAAAR